MSLRDIVIFPHMVAPLVVGREKSIKALEKAMAERTEIFLSTQIAPADDEPNEEGIYHTGTIAKVMQLLKLPDGTIKALVEGKHRARIRNFINMGDYLEVEVEEPADVLLDPAESVAWPAVPSPE